MLIKFLAGWLGLDAVLVATAVYGLTVIRPNFPDWWAGHIVADGGSDNVSP